MLFQCLRSAYQFFAHYFFSSQNRHTAAVITIIITFCWKSPRCRCGLTCSLPLLHTELVSARKIARLEKEKLSSWEWSCEVCTLQVRTCLAFYPFSNHKLRRWDALRDHHFLWLSPSLPPIALLQVLVVRTVRPACNDGRWCLGHLTLLSRCPSSECKPYFSDHTVLLSPSASCLWFELHQLWFGHKKEIDETLVQRTRSWFMPPTRARCFGILTLS